MPEETKPMKAYFIPDPDRQGWGWIQLRGNGERRTIDYVRACEPPDEGEDASTVIPEPEPELQCV